MSRKILHAKCMEDFGTPEGIRIPDLPLRRRTLYPAELLGHTPVLYPKLGLLSMNFLKISNFLFTVWKISSIINRNVLIMGENPT